MAAHLCAACQHSHWVGFQVRCGLLDELFEPDAAACGEWLPKDEKGRP